jgi:unsaturated rhamnogalacturonyl hydrolase
MPLQIAIDLADSFLAVHPPETLAWNWEPAVFLVGLDALRAHKSRFLQPIVDYHRAWARRRLPSIDRSDRCAPALTALSISPQFSEGLQQANAVAQYIEHANKNSLGALDHLGQSWFRWVYPPSIWVDSLMMYGVFAARYGAHLRATGDEKRATMLSDFAATQPIAFAKVLQDPHSGLFLHAFWTHHARVMPDRGTFWLRGNGWALVAMQEIASALGDHPRVPEIKAICAHLARGLASAQRADGGWDVLVGRSPLARDDTSGAALIAHGFFRGVRDGVLPPEFWALGARAIEFVERHVVRAHSDRAMALKNMSGPTNALPAWTYRWVPQVTNSPYGIGAYLLAASQRALGPPTNSTR